VWLGIDRFETTARHPVAEPFVEEGFNILMYCGSQGFAKVKSDNPRGTEMPNNIVMLLICITLAACGLDPQDYPAMSDNELCASYGLDNELLHNGGPLGELPARREQLARTEIDKRQLVPASQWPSIDQEKLDFGMGKCAVLAAWYKPDFTSKSRAGNIELEIWAYNNGRSVAFQNGAVKTVTEVQ